MILYRRFAVRHAPGTRGFPLIAVFALACAAQAGQADDRPEDVLTPPALDQFLVVPLRVHVLTATDLPDVDCQLTDADVTRIVAKVNRIWNMAGVHWALESLAREPAARQDRFRLIRDLGGELDLRIYRMLVPDSKRPTRGMDVYYLHRFPVNGVCFGPEGLAIVQETARLRTVEGGVDEPIPRVTAHELGHALGLSHRQDRTNLLASGTTGARLNTREVATVRRWARDVRGGRTVDALKSEAIDAEAAGNRAGARRTWSWIGAVPGGGDQARKALERLNAGARAVPDGPTRGAP